MIRKCLRPSLSVPVVLLAFAVPGCSESDSEPMLQIGSVGEALSRTQDREIGRDEAHSRAEPRYRKSFHVQQHRHRRCDNPPEPTPEPIVFTPAAAAARSGRRAGTAVDGTALGAEPLYAQLLAEQFSDLTPENATKWGSLQPAGPNEWDFDPADAIVAFARQAQLSVKGHTLVWHQQLPSFIDANTTPRDLERYTARHIERTVRHFRRDLFAWDVVNEAMADDGSGLRPTPFSDAFGERYIDRAFREAHEADPNAQLYYNDYGIEGPGAKTDAVYALMTRLLERHVPIDGIGLQAHFDARFVPSLDQLVANFQRFADLGLVVNISELDVRVAPLGGTRAYRLAVQKQIYQRVAAACAQVEACEGITTWGFTDAHSWIDATFGADDPLLFDDAYQKKPAYFGYVDGFLGVPLDDPSLEPNLIGNSSLEAGLDGWSAMGDAELSTDVAAAHTGVRSARASSRTAAWQGPRHDVSTLARAGRTYDASVWVRLSGAASANTTLTAQVACTGRDAAFVPVASAAASDSGWVALTGNLDIPDCTLESVALYVEGPDAGVDLLVDDLALRERPLPNLIVNSDFEAGTGGWFNFGPDVLGSSSDAHGGAGAAIATGRTDTWNGIATDLTARVVPTATYHAEAFLKIAGAASAPVALTAAVTCADGSTQFLPVGSATATNNDWARVSGSVTVPDCSLQSFYLYGEGPAAGVDLLLDDASFWQIDAGLSPNVITNSGFESGTDSWFGFGSVSVVATTDRAHGGTHSAWISGRTDTWNGLATNLIGRLTPGASYSVSAWAQVGTGSSPVNLTFQNACDATTTNFTFVAGATANASDWTQLRGTIVAPNCALTTGNLYIEGAPAGVDIYLDDVELRELP